MADAHLPNSHPCVTPGWRPLPFPRTPFINSIQTQQVKGCKDTRYAGFAPPDWCSSVGRALAVHGGFCAAAMLSTAQTFSRQLCGSALDPLHIHIDYLTPAPQGSFHVLVKTLHLGHSSMSLQTEIVAPGTDGPAYSLAIIRLGKLQMPPGGKSIQPAAELLPSREKDCVRGSSGLYYYASPPTSSIRAYVPKDGESRLWSPSFGGQCSRYQWAKLDDERLFQLEHILLLVDLIPVIPFNYENCSLEESVLKYKIPTMSLTVNFYEKVKNVEWLLTRARMQRLHNGRCDMDVQIIDDNGSIIATSTQVVAIIPRVVGEPKKIRTSL